MSWRRSCVRTFEAKTSSTTETCFAASSWPILVWWANVVTRGNGVCRQHDGRCFQVGSNCWCAPPRGEATCCCGGGHGGSELPVRKLRRKAARIQSVMFGECSGGASCAPQWLHDRFFRLESLWDSRSDTAWHKIHHWLVYAPFVCSLTANSRQAPPPAITRSPSKQKGFPADLRPPKQATSSNTCCIA